MKKVDKAMPEYRRFSFLREALRRLCVVLPLYLGMALLMPTGLLAQNSLGVVEGTITDTKGALIPAAQVNVLNRDTGVSIQTKSNKDGFYSVPALVPGSNYAVSIVKNGFQELTITGFAVESSNTTTISGVLKVGEVSTVVTVTAEGEMLNKDSAAVTTNMDEQLVDNLPYPEQGSLEVALLAPGVRGSQIYGSGLGSENPGIFIGNVEPGAQISINGAAAGHSAILVDGADVTQSSFARAGVTVSSAMAGQVTVVSNGVPAQYGRTLGGVVITSTKSGTNEYHGRVGWRHTDPLLQAQPDGLLLRPALHQNFFSMVLGGPVVIPKIYDGHNKTFFFFGFEPARFSNSTGQYIDAQTPDELQGKFHNDISLLDPTVINASGYQAAESAPRTHGVGYLSDRNSNGFPIGLPYTSLSGAAKTTAQNPTGLNYVPVPNDDLSALVPRNPLAAYLASHLPTPSNPQETIWLRPDALYQTGGPGNGFNVFEIRTVRNTDNRYAFRLDHTISSTDRMYARYSNTPLDAARTGLVTPDDPVSAWPSDASHAYNMLVDETHVFNLSLVNEFKVSYLLNRQNRQPPAASLTADFAAQFGLTPSTAGKGFPSISNIDGGLGTNQIFSNTDSTSQLQDDVTIVRGRHKIMVGLDLRRLQSNQASNPGLYGGNYSSNNSSTQTCQVGFVAGGTCTGGGGTGYASLVLGLVSSFSNQTASVTAHYRWQYYAAYLQDDFRILPKLTLNVGVRYEVETPRKELNDLQGTFVPAINGTLNGSAATGAFCFSGACGLPHTIFPMSYNGVQPRVGIAWAPLQKFTLRASYAILRIPLTGLSNTPAPNFGLAANSIGGNTGGAINNQPVDFITNPIAAGTPSAYAFLQGSRGPFFSVPSNLPIPYVRQSSTIPYSQQWSLTTQFQLFRRTLLEMGYNGAHNIHLFNNNQNPQNFPNLATFFADVAAGYSFNCTTVTANCPGVVRNPYSGSTFNLLQSLLPYPAFYNQATQISELYNRDGVSSYNAMYVSVTHHFDYGLSLQGSFTWSKSLDNDGADSANVSAGSGAGPALQTPFSRAQERAVSDFDVPALTSIGATYQLPYGTRGKYRLRTDGPHSALNFVDSALNHVLGDWSTGFIFRAQSSTPYLPTLGRSTPGYWFALAGPGYANAGTTAAALPVGINPRPSLVPGVPCINPLWHLTPASRFSATYINPQAFTIPGSINAPALGNAPRSMANCRSPRLINLDANLSKTIPVKGHEKMNFVLTLTAINAFNHPVYQFNGASGTSSVLFTSYLPGQTAIPRSGIDDPNIPFNLPPGFTASPSFGTVNPGFTAQFSRVVQVGAAFNF